MAHSDKALSFNSDPNLTALRDSSRDAYIAANRGEFGNTFVARVAARAFDAGWATHGVAARGEIVNPVREKPVDRRGLDVQTLFPTDAEIDGTNEH